MHYRTFKGLNHPVSEIGIGTWGLDAGKWGGFDEQEITRAYAMAKELGVNFIDTAAAYGEGTAEMLIGKIINQLGWRDVLLATKVQPLITLMTPIHADQAFPGKYVIESTERSLRNLGVDHIPLQQLHIWDSTWFGQGDWLDALYLLKQQGKIGAIGISLFDHAPDTALEIVDSGYIDAVQVIYNIFDQSPANELFDLCLKRNVSVIARSPLYEGVLSGNFTKGHQFEETDWRKGFFAGGHLEECLDRLSEITEGIPGVKLNGPADYALRFALSHPAVTTVITGMRSTDHVWNNCKASADYLLDPEELYELKQFDWMST